MESNTAGNSYFHCPKEAKVESDCFSATLCYRRSRVEVLGAFHSKDVKLYTGCNEFFGKIVRR